eukprot:COSAG03_NODE_27417_length_253_cov_0.675325_1_plen_47_part_10
MIEGAEEFDSDARAVLAAAKVLMKAVLGSLFAIVCGSLLRTRQSRRP